MPIEAAVLVLAHGVSLVASLEQQNFHGSRILVLTFLACRKKSALTIPVQTDPRQ